MTPFPQRPLLLGLSSCLPLMACDDRIHNICANHQNLCVDRLVATLVQQFKCGVYRPL